MQWWRVLEDYRVGGTHAVCNHQFHRDMIPIQTINLLVFCSIDCISPEKLGKYTIPLISYVVNGVLECRISEFPNKLELFFLFVLFLSWNATRLLFDCMWFFNRLLFTWLNSSPQITVYKLFPLDFVFFLLASSDVFLPQFFFHSNYKSKLRRTKQWKCTLKSIAIRKKAEETTMEKTTRRGWKTQKSRVVSVFLSSVNANLTYKNDLP